ncbi:DUF2520 domain-containing protein [Cellulophaga baltica]|uniref:Rossmann-like and DUF2520 domain-containing protein n=1 Tax=Cellulophaga TaxID=104264 RepID=UPI001C06A174|nr:MULTISPECIES: DUF2520 domain-containing protein [Cellulophaga]MBU2997306.1 DUF2520 domain-containing protein [Cellulophaga baltica]MDO6768704.1 DUF2520 domain-containing protein [Cellulophaga sp. 1_MG-2023]
MVSIVLIGTGNIATHLYDTFLLHKAINVVQVVGRSEKSLSFFAKKTETCLIDETIKTAAIYVIAVSDDAINSVSKKLQNKKGLVVHTSGSVPLSSLTYNKNSGVFYPLQTFTKGKKIDFKNIPICIEALQKDDFLLIEKLAKIISNKVYTISTEERQHLHVAAVFVNNFTNYMFTLGNEICEEHKVPFDILKPLINETVEKIADLTPKNAQTGPAKRNDFDTMQRHIEQLRSKEKKKIYKLLSESILEKYGKEL